MCDRSLVWKVWIRSAIRRNLHGTGLRMLGSGCVCALVLGGACRGDHRERDPQASIGAGARGPASRDLESISLESRDKSSRARRKQFPGHEEGSSQLETSRDPLRVERLSDSRAVPDGTKNAHARAFRRLPVAVSDGAPVGAIGANGIHLDSIELGTGWSRSRCEDLGTQFSISTGDRVNVCIRVVHPRAEEDVMVLWKKEGRIARRRKITIRNIHAFRTRAYLALRPEYTGSWRVEVISTDGAVLGSASFEVVE